MAQVREKDFIALLTRVAILEAQVEELKTQQINKEDLTNSKSPISLTAKNIGEINDSK